MDDFKGFLHEYRGAIIGAILAIIILCTGFLKLALVIIVIGAGIFLGNYVQHNKYEVKQKLLDFINRM
ncbi:MAG: DUF2273 domain-containing protein [Clostridia bacterium]|nr:DUF2273 domain-containing protein [Clostridia bacterium]MCI9275264.1 DUF2273 domain-containing protein [Clostridia bacterium]